VNETGGFAFRLQFVPEPNAGTPLMRCQILPQQCFRRAQDSKRKREGQSQIMNRIHAFAAGSSAFM
jgi:hypothetical protein